MDRSTLTDLYTRFGPVVHRKARVLLGSDDEARDALQEVFARAVERERELRFEHAESPERARLAWLYRVTTNLCLNRLRQRKAHPVAVTAEAPDALFARGDAEAERLDRDTLVRLFAAVDAETQEIAVYYFLDDLNMDEVAALVGRSRKTVGRKLEALRERARALGR